MSSDFFFLAGWFCAGLFLSNFTYLISQYFWLCTITGVAIAIGLCFPSGKAEILRRWSALAIIGGMLVNNWELLGRISVVQFVIGAIAILLIVGILIAVIGAIGGKNG
ncbi:hypothetical protein QUA70_12425 [Microcoleus sp. LAD1_D5]|uniref:hypothetical protein n=1 Tax=unclassified Microcoleus TaxID=2642155 RepID=UPI002FCF1B5D